MIFKFNHYIYINLRIRLFLFIIVLFYSIITCNPVPVYSKDLTIENKKNEAEKILALNYCDSREKKLFNGLENESILKYEYFFSSLGLNKIEDPSKFLENLTKSTQTLCGIELTELDKVQIKKFIKTFNGIKQSKKSEK